MKKAIIFDLDNTIYPTETIGEKLFKPLIDHLKNSEMHADKIEDIKKDIMRIPFQAVAERYNIKDELKEECMNILKELSYDGPIKPFEDFNQIRQLPVDRFLVTTGFKKMQQSKVKALNLDRDFKGIYIIDPTTTEKKKKDLFKEIMQDNGYEAADVLVIGDDPDSEIKGATELGIETVLYDKKNEHEIGNATYKISDYGDLKL